MARNAFKLQMSFAALLLASCAFGQQVQQQQEVSARTTSSSKADVNAAKASKEDAQLATQMLEISESTARGFEAPMRAYSLLQIAQVHVTLDKKKAIEMLKDAFTASLGIRDDNFTKQNLQEDIFRTLLPLSQPDVEELLPQAEPRPRKQASEQIISRYIESKNFEPAIDLVNQITRFDEFPYGTGGKLMMAMPDEMSGERMSLFAQAVNSYKNHEHKGILAGSDTLTYMVASFGSKMPPKVVMQAVDEILSQARKDTDNASNAASITVSGAGGTTSFGSNYEYQLFALLPLIERLDEGRAKQLLEDNQSLKNKLAQYSNGLASIDPGMTDPKARHSGMSTSVHSGTGISGVNLGYQQAQEAMRQAEKIVSDAGENPSQAIAQAAALPVSNSVDKRVSPRAQALEGIAQQVWKDSPSAAKQALDELRKLLPDLPLQLQVRYLGSAANMYLKLNDQESAEKAVTEGFKIADKILENDTNADHPNSALKAWWPSVDAYRRFIEVETRISERKAIKILTEIKDPEIRTVESIMVSRSMLGMPVKRVMIVERSKSGNSVSVHSED